MRCITVSYGLVSGAAKRYPYYQPAEYTVVTTSRKKRRVWKYVSHLGNARRSERLAERDAIEYARAKGIAFIPNIRAWKEVDDVLRIP